MIYVTHDQVEAMTLADKIVVLRAGRIEQVGAPMDLYRDPDNRFVAGFIGSPSMNFIRGTVKGGEVVSNGLAYSVPKTGSAQDGQEVLIGLRPEHLTLKAGSSHRVDLTESLGGVSYVHLIGPDGGKIIVEERGDHRSAIGDQVDLVVDPDHMYLFDATSELRLR